MNKKFLITAGHLGNVRKGKDDVGAVGEPGDAFGGELSPQQERWINLQQLCGMAAAAVADGELDIMFAVPDDHFDPLGLDDRLIVPDVPFTLTGRAELANRLDRCLIELHNNAAAVSQARGAECIVWSGRNRDGSRSEAHKIASSIMGELDGAGLRNRGVKTCADLGRTLTILKKTRHPAVITEVGFLSNIQEATRLDVDLDGFNERAGALIYRGLKQYTREAS